MSRFAGYASFLLMLVFAGGVAVAQCQEPMDAVNKNHTTEGAALGNAWGCPTSGNSGSPECGVYYRFYTTDATGNGKVNAGSDGNPIYLTNARGCYRTDVDNSLNYFDGPHECGKPMYIIWDGELDGSIGDHRSYYGAQGQLIYAGEVGNVYAECGGDLRFISCFAAIGGAEAVDILNTPQGTLQHTGGLMATPVPLVDSYDRVTGDIVLSWTAPENFHPTGEGETNPILGVNLYILEDPDVLDSRAVTSADLDAGAVFKQRIDLPATTATLNDATDLGSGTGSFIPILKVIYQPNAGGVDPFEGRFFSANGSVVLIDTALLTEVTDFQAEFLGRSRGFFSFDVSWNTVTEDGLEGFVLKRGSSLEGPFVAVTDVMPPRGRGEGASYSVVDTFRPRGEREFFYLLEIHEAGDRVDTHGPIRATGYTGHDVERPRKVGRQPGL